MAMFDRVTASMVLTSLEIKIAEYLGEAGSDDLFGVAQEMGYTHQYISQIMRSLDERGIIEKSEESPDRFQLTERYRKMHGPPMKRKAYAKL